MAVNSEILEIAEIIRQSVPADRIYLFGSYAYGEPNENSDYDFYVVLENGTLRAYDAQFSIRKAISQQKKFLPFDILTSSVKDFDDRSRLLTLERKVANEGVLLYERNGFDIRMA
jgi:predicted nucleotidyltransferase